MVGSRINNIRQIGNVDCDNLFPPHIGKPHAVGNIELPWNTQEEGGSEKTESCRGIFLLSLRETKYSDVSVSG